MAKVGGFYAQEMDCYHVWRGQLIIGMKNIGSATIWSQHSSYIPALGGKLCLRYSNDIHHLWRRILRTDPVQLSYEDPVKVGNKMVSAFAITSHQAQFCHLAQELHSERKILVDTVLNPGIGVEVVVAPACTLMEGWGLKANELLPQPVLHILFIISNQQSSPYASYRDQRNFVLRNNGSHIHQDGIGILTTRKAGVGAGAQLCNANWAKSRNDNQDLISKSNAKSSQLFGEESRPKEFTNVNVITSCKSDCNDEKEIISPSPSLTCKDGAYGKKETNVGNKPNRGDRTGKKSRSKMLMLDTQKLHKAFRRKDKTRPDIIRPSMLKKTKKLNKDLCQGLEASNTNQEGVEMPKTSLPDVVERVLVQNENTIQTDVDIHVSSCSIHEDSLKMSKGRQRKNSSASKSNLSVASETGDTKKIKKCISSSSFVFKKASSRKKESEKSSRKSSPFSKVKEVVLSIAGKRKVEEGNFSKVKEVVLSIAGKRKVEEGKIEGEKSDMNPLEKKLRVLKKSLETPGSRWKPKRHNKESPAFMEESQEASCYPRILERFHYSKSSEGNRSEFEDHKSGIKAATSCANRSELKQDRCEQKTGMTEPLSVMSHPEQSVLQNVKIQNDDIMKKKKEFTGEEGQDVKMASVHRSNEFQSSAEVAQECDTGIKSVFIKSGDSAEGLQLSKALTQVINEGERELIILKNDRIVDKELHMGASASAYKVANKTTKDSNNKMNLKTGQRAVTQEILMDDLTCIEECPQPIVKVCLQPERKEGQCPLDEEDPQPLKEEDPQPLKEEGPQLLWYDDPQPFEDPQPLNKELLQSVWEGDLQLCREENLQLPVEESAEPLCEDGPHMFSEEFPETFEEEGSQSFGRDSPQLLMEEGFQPVRGEDILSSVECCQSSEERPQPLQKGHCLIDGGIRFIEKGQQHIDENSHFLGNWSHSSWKIQSSQEGIQSSQGGIQSSHEDSQPSHELLWSSHGRPCTPLKGFRSLHENLQHLVQEEQSQEQHPLVKEPKSQEDQHFVQQKPQPQEDKSLVQPKPQSQEEWMNSIEDKTQSVEWLNLERLIPVEKHIKYSREMFQTQLKGTYSSEELHLSDDTEVLQKPNLQKNEFCMTAVESQAALRESDRVCYESSSQNLGKLLSEKVLRENYVQSNRFGQSVSCLGNANSELNRIVEEIKSHNRVRYYHGTPGAITSWLAAQLRFLYPSVEENFMRHMQEGQFPLHYEFPENRKANKNWLTDTEQILISRCGLSSNPEGILHYHIKDKAFMDGTESAEENEVFSLYTPLKRSRNANNIEANKEEPVINKKTITSKLNSGFHLQSRLISLNTKGVMLLAESAPPDWDKMGSFPTISQLMLKQIETLYLYNPQEMSAKLEIFLDTHHPSCAKDIEESYDAESICICLQVRFIETLFWDEELVDLILSKCIKFGIYTCLSDISKGQAMHILYRGTLLLIHHTSLTDTSVGDLVEGFIGNRQRMTCGHLLVLPVITLKTCYYVLKNARNLSSYDFAIRNTMKRTMELLVKCVSQGLAVLTPSSGEWKALGPCVKLKKYLVHLPLLHRRFHYQHRIVKLVIGSDFLHKVDEQNPQYYGFVTAQEVCRKGYLE